MISRRRILTGLAGAGIGSMGLGGYAFAEGFGLTVAHYNVVPPRWPAGLNLRLALIADLHVAEPWMPASRVRAIVAQTNALNPDAALLLGDFVAGHGLARWGSRVPHEVWAAELAALSAPLGIHAILGNHDWWEESTVQRARSGPTQVGLSLRAAGIPVYENTAVRLSKDGHPFWIAGLGDQWAFYFTRAERRGLPPNPIGYYQGVDDLAGTLAAVTDDAPVILMVHEPDIFPQVPERVALTVAGHTHGGQVRVLGYAPIVPSRFGTRYVYGHVVENDRNLIVSAGLGCSGAPVRFGAPPEITIIDLGQPRAGLA